MGASIGGCTASIASYLKILIRSRVVYSLMVMAMQSPASWLAFCCHGHPGPAPRASVWGGAPVGAEPSLPGGSLVPGTVSRAADLVRAPGAATPSSLYRFLRAGPAVRTRAGGAGPSSPHQFLVPSPAARTVVWGWEQLSGASGAGPSSPYPFLVPGPAARTVIWCRGQLSERLQEALD